MEINFELLQRYEELKTEINKVRDFNCLFPEDLSQQQFLLNFIIYFIEPTNTQLDSLTESYSIFLSEDEKLLLYPLIINFILYVKKIFLETV